MQEKTPQEEITAIRKAFCPPVKTVEYNKALCEKYPFLTWHGDPLYFDYDENKEPDYEYTWEDELPEGWRKAFCPQIWDDLKAILEKADYVNEFKFSEIKEKWGSLRIYHDGVPEEIFDDILSWESKYEKLSEEVCINCGKPAMYMTTGYITFICDDCKKKMKKDSLNKHVPAVPISDLEEFYKDPKTY